MVIPTIKSIRMMEKYYLLLLFDDETVKLYNAKKLFGFSVFKDLQNEDFFHSGEINRSGSAIIWSDYIDSGAYEFWSRGTTIDLQPTQFTNVSLPQLLALQTSIKVLGLLRRQSDSEVAKGKIQRLCDFLRQDVSFIYVYKLKIHEIFEKVRKEKIRKIYVNNIFSLAWVESEIITLCVLLQEEGVQFYDLAGRVLLDDDFFIYDNVIKRKLQSGLGIVRGGPPTGYR